MNKNARQKRRRLRRQIAMVFVATLAAMPGCATRSARIADAVGESKRVPYTQRPHLYPASRYVIHGGAFQHGVCKAFGESVEAHERTKPTAAFSIDGDRIVRYLFIYMPISVVLATGTVIVELPVALITDTALIPYDVYRIRTDLPSDAAFAEALLGETWPVSGRTLRTLYRPPGGDPAIRRLLETPDLPHFSERVGLLIELGLGLDLLANADSLDAGNAEVLIHMALNDADAATILSSLARNPHVAPEALRTLAPLAVGGSWTVLAPLLAANPAATGDVLDRLVPTVPAEALNDTPDMIQAWIVAAGHTAIRPETLDRLADIELTRVQSQVAQHPSTPPVALERLAASPNPAIADDALRNPGASPEVLRRLTMEPERWHALAANPALPPETLEILFARITADPDTFRPIPLEALAGHPKAPAALILRLIALCRDHPHAFKVTYRTIWNARYNLIWRKDIEASELRELTEVDRGLEGLLRTPGFEDRSGSDCFQSGSHILLEAASHPRADAVLLIDIIRACRAHPKGHIGWLSSARFKAEMRLSQEAATPIDILMEVAAHTTIRDVLKHLAEHPAATPALLQAVIARCDERLAAIPTEPDARNPAILRHHLRDHTAIRDNAAARLASGSP